MSQFVYLALVFPLLGFLLNGLGGRRWSKPISGGIACASVLASFVVSLLVFNEVRQEDFSAIQVHLFDFIGYGFLHVPFALQVDQLSVLFLLIITGVGTLIHIYSTAYMKEETAPHFARYFAYLNLFIFAMLLLVLANNYVIMFIGWEGVGLCSYLLIGFWFKNHNYNRAARKAFVINRIGDLAFLIGIFWLFFQFGTVEYASIFSQAQNIPVAALTGITLLLFIGATGKSAQIPLFTWLPDAMAGPTPVSALIHAATMVTAGVYMIARSNILYTLAPVTQSVVAITGLATALLAASIALKQNDIKKILAYSTISQLGYMFLALGMGIYVGAVFHVMTHAFFKALLFLGAGSVIHGMSGEQDIRKMGGLKKQMPVTHATFLIGCLAIAGIPPLAGFFSKDEILNHTFAHSPLLYILGFLCALMTAYYIFRLYTLTFRGQFRGSSEQAHHIHESTSKITVPLIILAVLSIAGGWVGIPGYMFPDIHLLDHFLEPIFSQSNAIVAMPYLSNTTQWILDGGVILILGVIYWAYRKYSRYVPNEKEATGLAKFLERKWYVDEIYNTIITVPLRRFADFLTNTVEKGIDGVVNGVGYVIQYGSRQLRMMQTGGVRAYLLMMVAGIILILILKFFI